MRRHRIPRSALRSICAVPLLCAIWGGRAIAQSAPRTINILADHDSRFKLPGQSDAVLTLTAGEPVILRFTAKKAKTRNRDGSVHGFTLLRLKDHTRVTGWDFLLKPGVQEFDATTPDAPGDYEAICTVICSGHHEGMTLKVVVVPPVHCAPTAKGEGNQCQPEKDGSHDSHF